MRRIAIGFLALTFALATLASCTYMKHSSQPCNGTKVGNKR
jgi:hypothetical protein